MPLGSEAVATLFYDDPVATSVAYDAVLGPTERVEGRSFTDPVCTRNDVAVMTTMLLRQRAIADSWPRDRAGPTSAGERDPGRRREFLAVPDAAALLGARDVTAVGFFGQARDVDHTVLFELEDEVADSFPAYARAGLLSYYDLQLEDGSYGFGNLILFTTPDVPRDWFGNDAHNRAVALSPDYYFSVRLHKGSIPGHFLGEGELTLERTKYFDFDSDPPWRGLRLLATDG